jgi:RND family efflux transporter MFP subunit
MNADRPTLDGLRIDRTNAPRRKRLPGPVVAGLVILLLIAAGLTWWFNRAQPLAVHTATARSVASGQSTTLLNASGYVTARREATVSSKVTGKILEVLVEEGSKVQTGDILARVDASNTEASLRLAEAQLNAAHKALEETNASLAFAELDLRRQRELAAKKIISQSDLDSAEASARALRGRHERELAEVDVAERQVGVWKQQLDDTVIRAPFAGVVTSKNAQPGEMISPMSAGGFTRTGVCTLVDMTSLEIEVDVSESYINRVEPDQPVTATLDSYPDWHIPAHVIAIIPSADRQKATVKVRVGFEKLDPRILPDMGVKVAFQSGDKPDASAAPAVMIPRAAVHRRDGRDVVWVVHHARVTPRAVAFGAPNGDEIAVASGLAAGEKVVVGDTAGLTDGAPITETTP